MRLFLRFTIIYFFVQFCDSHSLEQNKQDFEDNFKSLNSYLTIVLSLETDLIRSSSYQRQICKSIREEEEKRLRILLDYYMRKDIKENIFKRCSLRGDIEVLTQIMSQLDQELSENSKKPMVLRNKRLIWRGRFIGILLFKYRRGAVLERKYSKIGLCLIGYSVGMIILGYVGCFVGVFRNDKMIEGHKALHYPRMKANIKTEIKFRQDLIKCEEDLGLKVISQKNDNKVYPIHFVNSKVLGIMRKSCTFHNIVEISQEKEDILRFTKLFIKKSYLNLLKRADNFVFSGTLCGVLGGIVGGIVGGIIAQGDLLSEKLNRVSMFGPILTFLTFFMTGSLIEKGVYYKYLLNKSFTEREKQIVNTYYVIRNILKLKKLNLLKNPVIDRMFLSQNHHGLLFEKYLKESFFESKYGQPTCF